MSLIEGIGDEVTILAICLLVVAVIIIAWSSTRVDVRTHTSVVIIDRETTFIINVTVQQTESR